MLSNFGGELVHYGTSLIREAIKRRRLTQAEVQGTQYLTYTLVLWSSQATMPYLRNEPIALSTYRATSCQ
jgi:hypothetical protein